MQQSLFANTAYNSTRIVSVHHIFESFSQAPINDLNIYDNALLDQNPFVVGADLNLTSRNTLCSGSPRERVLSLIGSALTALAILSLAL